MIVCCITDGRHDACFLTHVTLFLAATPAGYLQLSSDICDIKTAIGDGPTPPYADAQRIYQNGKNSRKSDGSIRTLRGEYQQWQCFLHNHPPSH